MREGILTTRNAQQFSLESASVQRFSLTMVLASTLTDLRFIVTNTYGSADHADSLAFLDSLHALATDNNGPWLVMGDFNLIRGAVDKNNDNIDLALCGHFNATINLLALIEIPLIDRKYTWSNHREQPTLERIDWVFFNTDLNDIFPNSAISSQVRQTSDHTPLLLQLSSSIPKASVFHFENSWLLHADFLPKVLPAWHGAPSRGSAANALAAGLKAVRREAKVWARKKTYPSHFTLQLQIPHPTV